MVAPVLQPGFCFCRRLPPFAKKFPGHDTRHSQWMAVIGVADHTPFFREGFRKPSYQYNLELSIPLPGRSSNPSHPSGCEPSMTHPFQGSLCSNVWSLPVQSHGLVSPSPRLWFGRVEVCWCGLPSHRRIHSRGEKLLIPCPLMTITQHDPPLCSGDIWESH